MNNPPLDMNRRVLIIDDNHSIHADFRKILSPATTPRPALDAAEAALFGHPTRAIQPTQFEVDSAYQGEEGVTLAKKALEEARPYAIAFVDVRMPPGWDGIETTQKLWENDPDIQVVICTAYSDYSWSDMCGMLGNRDGLVILKKPFDTVEALQLAHALTTKWWLHQQSLRKIEHLERLVDERTSELRKTNEALQLDIAERRRTETMLKTLSVRQESLLAAIPDVIMEVDCNRIYTWANRAGFDFFGDDVIGKEAASYFVGEQETYQVVQPVFAGDANVVYVESWQRRKDGEKRRLAWWCRVMKDAHGHVTGALSTARDITERQWAEEALRKANLELREALQKLEDTHNQMIQQARMSALGQMASGIAHGFNNVLTPILGYSHLMLSDPKTLDNRDDTLSMLKDIHTAANDAKHMVQRLRMIRGSADEGRHMPLDMNDIARNAVEMTRPRWDKELGIRGIRINVSTNLRATRQTLGDVSELREALMNLVLNAVDAMPEGGSLTLSSDVKNDEVVVEVSDTGTGMTDETRKRCLEPFFTTKGVMGTGLGLSMVHGIVTRHNGTMKIDTTLGRGTRIQIRLPCAPGKAPTSGTKPEKAEDHPVMAPLKILVVDDEPLLLKFIERSLQMDGHSIKTAQTGHEAIGKASAETFDLVITDRAMPDVNGDLVARAVKKHHPETPVILMTGFGDLMKDEGEHPEGVDIILSKPATVREMRRGIAEAMALRRKTP